MNTENIASKLTLIKGNHLTCQDFEYLHQDYLDGDLTAMLMSEMRNHECHCEECQGYSEDINYLIKQARTLLKERPLPADTRERLYSKLNQKFNLQLS